MITLFSKFLLSLAILHASSLVVRAFDPPNPDPAHAINVDPVGNPTYLRMTRSYATVLQILGVLHSLFTLLAPQQRKAICVPGSDWNPDLFTWYWPSMSLLALSLFGGHLRLIAYRQLQEDFTFRLARPSKLVQSGVYRYIQHPSYTGFILLLCCYAWLVVRPDGVMGCAVDAASPGVWWYGVRGFVYLNALYLVILVGVMIPVRIWQEKVLLREPFGEEWEEYNRKTAWVVPWIL